jgi:hypothetical protein
MFSLLSWFHSNYVRLDLLRQHTSAHVSIRQHTSVYVCHEYVRLDLLRSRV